MKNQSRLGRSKLDVKRSNFAAMNLNLNKVVCGDFVDVFSSHGELTTTFISAVCVHGLVDPTSKTEVGPPIFRSD